MWCCPGQAERVRSAASPGSEQGEVIHPGNEYQGQHHQHHLRRVMLVWEERPLVVVLFVVYLFVV
jgi:hypothetical protein